MVLSQTIVVSRWLVIPRVTMSEVVYPAASSFPRAILIQSLTADRISRGSCSAQPSCGDLKLMSMWWAATSHFRMADTIWKWNWCNRGRTGSKHYPNLGRQVEGIQFPDVVTSWYYFGTNLKKKHYQNKIYKQKKLTTKLTVLVPSSMTPIRGSFMTSASLNLTDGIFSSSKINKKNVN